MHKFLSLLILVPFFTSCFYESKENDEELKFVSNNEDTTQFKTYWPNGSIKSIGLEYDGKAVGYVLNYDSLNNLYSKSFWRNDTNIAESIFYYPDGLIETYMFRHFDGLLRYKADYDKKGNLLKEQGSLDIMVDITNEKLIHEIGEETEMLIFYPSPPHFETKLFFGLMDEEGNIFGEEELEIGEKGFFRKKIKFTKRGTFACVVLLDRTNLITGEGYTREIFFSVPVK